tara:strand:+ start:1767 stop:1949 length:183 start_codon:yes stop_codon:yes gene_type:complete
MSSRFDNNRIYSRVSTDLFYYIYLWENGSIVGCTIIFTRIALVIIIIRIKIIYIIVIILF